MFFYTILITKNIRNSLLRKGNPLSYPKLMLSSRFVLEAGIYSVKWIQDLHHKNKDKSVRNMRMHKNMAHVDNLSKQKVSPALNL